jgi:hypothetical protein
VALTAGLDDLASQVREARAADPVTLARVGQLRSCRERQLGHGSYL